MQEFYGTKHIAAKLMSRAEYNELRRWQLPADEGYLVEYLDGGTPNLEGYLGYVSWSPKEQFEKAYQALSALSFGHAIEAMKMGHRLTRGDWENGPVFYFAPYQDGVTITQCNPDGEKLAASFCINDILANDWRVVSLQLENPPSATDAGEPATCSSHQEDPTTKPEISTLDNPPHSTQGMMVQT